MDIEELWDKARKRTEILRMRLQDLATFESTMIPYVFLGESTVNPGDTVVRKGHVRVDRPFLALPEFSPQFKGFEFEEHLHLSDEAVATFLLVRGVHFPSLHYRHQQSSLDLIERPLQQSVDHIEDELKRTEDIQTGLVVGPEDAWQFSILLLVGALVVRSVEGDLRRIIEVWRKRQRRA